MLRAAEDERDPERNAQARLQLAIMYQMGYGVAPDSSEALRQLEAATVNKVARLIFGRVRTALGPNEQGQEEGDSGSSLDGVLQTSEPSGAEIPENETLDFGNINVASLKYLPFW